jgi:hypothetical protein
VAAAKDPELWAKFQAEYLDGDEQDYQSAVARRAVEVGR